MADARPSGSAPAKVAWVTMDCTDPERLAGFWSALLGVEEDGRVGDPPLYILLKARPGASPVQFQRVPEPKLGKARAHLDLAVEDVDAVTRLVEELGGARAPGEDFDEGGYRWRVMTDPEGNELCLLFGSAPG